MKLGLGTVQFGIDYGVTNRQGKPSADEIKTILCQAAEAGIKVIDTAALYGESERVLGQTLEADDDFSIITKTPAFGGRKIEECDIIELKNIFLRSLALLKREKLYGLLLHHGTDLLAGNGKQLWTAMRELQEAGKVSRIGVSVYNPAELESILDCCPDLSVVQLPLNIFDQRFWQDGWLTRLKEKDVEVHVRSVFLQGILLEKPECLPPYFNQYQMQLQAYQSFLRETGLTPIRAALGFVCGVPEVDCVLTGVAQSSQLTEIIAAAQPLEPEVFRQLAVADLKLTQPMNWKGKE